MMHIKLKSTPGIYLVGFMGSGKSTIGRELAERLGWTFVDLDDEIEAAGGISIQETFERFGEPAFRLLERKALLDQTELVAEGEARVVALGGGTFIEPRNRECIEGAGVSIWLDAPVEDLWKRVKHESHRPLARNREAFAALLEERKPAYAKADFRLEVSQGGQSKTIQAILNLKLV